jgi:hypothetical protein
VIFCIDNARVYIKKNVEKVLGARYLSKNTVYSLPCMYLEDVTTTEYMFTMYRPTEY